MSDIAGVVGGAALSGYYPNGFNPDQYAMDLKNLYRQEQIDYYNSRGMNDVASWYQDDNYFNMHWNYFKETDPTKRLSENDYKYLLGQWQSKRTGSPGAGGGGLSNQQKAAQFLAEIKNIAGILGLGESPDWADLANQAVSNGWSVEILRDMVADHITMDTSKAPGMVHNIFAQTKAAASDYFLNVSDEQMLSWAKQIAKGDLETNAIMPMLQQAAKNQYSWLANTIDSGVTLKDYFKPHREEIANLLEVSPDSIDFLNDNRWRNVLRRVPTQDDPLERSMTISETSAYVRGLDDWKKTQNAKTEAASAVTALGKMMGVM